MIDRLGVRAALIITMFLSLLQGTSAAAPKERYLVLLEDSVGNPRAVAEEHARDHAAEVSHVYSHALKGYAASFPEGRVRALQHDPRVELVEVDRPVAIDAQTIPTGINRMDADLSPAARIDGNDERIDVDIAIIDTGVDATHPDLDVVASTDCTVTGLADVCADGVGTDEHGHGTHVAGTAAALDNGSGVVGVAPGARIHAVKVLTAVGSGFNSAVIAGIDWVTARSSTIEVANLSLSNQGGGYDSIERVAIANAVAKGVVVVAAAGNLARDVYGVDGVFGTGDDVSPAAFPEAMTISALADFDGVPGGYRAGTYRFALCTESVDDSFACFSNYSRSVVAGNPVTSSGGAIDLMLPGVGIYSTAPGGFYASMSGTSMAAPHAAGLVGIYIASNARDRAGWPNTAADVYSVRQALIDTAEAQTGSKGLAVHDDPDSNNERLGWAAAIAQQAFSDVPPTHPFYRYVEALYAAGISGGCAFDSGTGERRYCPSANVTRGQMAKFLMVADGQSELRPATPTFADVPAGHTFFGWIERLIQQGVTSGCATDASSGERRYCPGANVTRGQMAKFLMVADGQSELRPATPTFADVPASYLFYGWIERSVQQGITSGCFTDPSTGARYYCPSDPVNRGQMAKFLALAFDL